MSTSHKRTFDVASNSQDGSSVRPWTLLQAILVNVVNKRLLSEGPYFVVARKDDDCCNHIWQRTNTPPKLVLRPMTAFLPGDQSRDSLKISTTMRISRQNTCSCVGDEQEAKLTSK